MVSVRIPSVKIPDQADRRGMGRPYCKINALLSIDCHRMSAQFFIDFIMGSISEQISVNFCDFFVLCFSHGILLIPQPDSIDGVVNFLWFANMAFVSIPRTA